MSHSSLSVGRVYGPKTGVRLKRIEMQEGETVWAELRVPAVYKISRPSLAVVQDVSSNVSLLCVSAGSVFDGDLPSREYKEVHEPGEDG